MGKLSNCKRMVIKLGSSTLTHESGHINIRRMEEIVKILSDFKNSGIEVIVVSSGAVSAGVARTKLGRRPGSVREKQAMAAVGQSEIMRMYDKFFSSYGHTVAQILMTKDVVEDVQRREACEDTFNTLLEMGCVPIVNENDSVSTAEIKFGGNDTLSAYVALVAKADVVLNLSDIEGLYDSDPRKNPNAKFISRVDSIDEELVKIAGGAGTERGTGGMATKIEAAKILTEAGISMFILNGHRPEVLYELFDGVPVGTYFKAKEKAVEK
ncbi:MAG: glutamate 5-kinase [Ruminococcaceae bacterium]|nr:glutamate 5-kinase [Oscillospiraceae bacterium]MBO4972302.1 glutamate 5-kinase [Clostridia bacterium]MBQ1259496.1 glutamate 5-kinase [Clostridia bacterium]